MLSVHNLQINRPRIFFKKILRGFLYPAPLFGTLLLQYSNLIQFQPCNLLQTYKSIKFQSLPRRIQEQIKSLSGTSNQQPLLIRYSQQNFSKQAMRLQMNWFIKVFPNDFKRFSLSGTLYPAPSISTFVIWNSCYQLLEIFSYVCRLKDLSEMYVERCLIKIMSLNWTQLRQGCHKFRSKLL